MREYGGDLPLDSCGREYYCDTENYEVVRMNAARYAIVMAAKDYNAKKVWIPVYTCNSVYDALESAGITYDTYNIDHNFQPIEVSLAEREMILVTNYFGLYTRDIYDQFIKKYNAIIFDNTQSFFDDPIIKEHIYNIYSPRKFFGVSDGAYLITKHMCMRKTLKQDVSSERAKYIFRVIENNTNSLYSEYLKSEDDISASGAREMSKLTKHILQNINYEYIREKRVNNFKYMNRLLKPYNLYQIDKIGKCPMIYPFVFEDSTGELRKYLIANKIYIPQWWKWVLDNEKSNEWEKLLSNSLFPLPIDQRYDYEDMEYICNIIMTNFR